MRRFLSITLIAMLISNIAFATIRRVGSTGTTPNVDYSSLQGAHDASTSGDTIYIYPGKDMTCTVNRKVVIVGPGFFLNPADATYPGNAGLQTFTNTTTTSAPFILLAGSEGSEIYGCNFELINGTNASPVYLDGGASGNVLFKRCRFYSGVSAYPAITFVSNCSQVNTSGNV